MSQGKSRLLSWLRTLKYYIVDAQEEVKLMRLLVSVIIVCVWLEEWDGNIVRLIRVS